MIAGAAGAAVTGWDAVLAEVARRGWTIQSLTPGSYLGHPAVFHISTARLLVNLADPKSVDACMDILGQVDARPALTLIQGGG